MVWQSGKEEIMETELCNFVDKIPRRTRYHLFSGNTYVTYSTLAERIDNKAKSITDMQEQYLRELQNPKKD